MMPYQNPYLTNPYMQQAIMQPAMQQIQAPVMQQQAGASIRVSGRDEAMNRFLMMYPASTLVPGFISDALFDIDGRHFHALSIESDGSRNLETFSYQIETSQSATKPADYVSRAEFQGLVDRINQLTGGSNGISEPVQPAAAATGQPA